MWREIYSILISRKKLWCVIQWLRANDQNWNDDLFLEIIDSNEGLDIILLVNFKNVM
jgi:hypothetical protein